MGEVWLAQPGLAARESMGEVWLAQQFHPATNNVKRFHELCPITTVRNPTCKIKDNKRCAQIPEKLKGPFYCIIGSDNALNRSSRKIWEELYMEQCEHYPGKENARNSTNQLLAVGQFYFTRGISYRDCVPEGLLCIYGWWGRGGWPNGRKPPRKLPAYRPPPP